MLLAALWLEWYVAKFDYAEAREDAKELIAEFGMVMSVEKPDGSNKQNFTGVLLDLSYKDKQNSLLVSATAKVLTADVLKRDASDDGDFITIAGVTYAVVSTEVLRPGGVDVLYTIYVRK